VEQSGEYFTVLNCIWTGGNLMVKQNKKASEQNQKILPADKMPTRLSIFDAMEFLNTTLK
jgi:hypothetical protein